MTNTKLTISIPGNVSAFEKVCTLSEVQANNNHLDNAEIYCSKSKLDVEWILLYSQLCGFDIQAASASTVCCTKEQYPGVSVAFCTRTTL